MRNKVQKLLIVFSLALLSGCENGGERHITVIGEYAVPKGYPESGWSSWYQRHGTERMKEAEKLVSLAAQKMADTGVCEELEIVDLSDRSKVGEFVFFGDCAKNGNRIYVTESELISGKSIKSQVEKAWDENETHKQCREMILANVTRPNQADIDYILGSAVRTIPTTHRVVVTMTFDAMNDFGVKTSYEARCYFDPGVVVGKIETHQR